MDAEISLILHIDPGHAPDLPRRWQTRPFIRSTMVLFRSTNLVRTTRALPRLRAYSTGGPKQTINEASHNDTKKAGSNVGLITFSLVGAVAAGVYFFSDDLKSSLAGGHAAGDKSVLSQQKEGKMVTPFQK